MATNCPNGYLIHEPIRLSDRWVNRTRPEMDHHCLELEDGDARFTLCIAAGSVTASMREEFLLYRHKGDAHHPDGYLSTNSWDEVAQKLQQLGIQ